MAENFTTESLISGVKRRGSIPENQNLFTASDLLSMADDELRSVLFPMLMNLHGEYFVTTTDYTMVAGVTEYAIPSTAIATKLRDVTVLSPDGLSEVSIPQLSPDTVYDSTGSSSASRGNLGFFIRGNNVKVFPQEIAGDILRLYFFRRPNKLVETSAAGQILSINTSLNLLTLSNVPSTWIAGDTVCSIDSKPGFDLHIESRALTDVSAPTITLASIADFVVGDWVCREGESTIAQIPVEAHPILEQATTVRALLALGDPRWQDQLTQLSNMVNAFTQMTSGRVEGEPKSLSSSAGISNFIGNYGGRLGAR